METKKTEEAIRKMAAELKHDDLIGRLMLSLALQAVKS